MGTFVNQDLYVSIGGTDYSDHVEAATLKIGRDELDFTNAGSAGYKEFKTGFAEGSLDITFQQDFAASGLTQDLYSKVIAGAAVTIIVAADGSTASTSNPTYSASYLPPSLELLGQVTQKATHSTTWKLTGSITVATS